MRKEVWIFIIIDKVSEGKVSVIVKMTTTIKKLFSLHQRHEEWTLNDTTPPNIGYNLWKCKHFCKTFTLKESTMKEKDMDSLLQNEFLAMYLCQFNCLDTLRVL